VSVVVLTACAPAAAPTPVVIKETVVVEKAVETIVEKPVETIVEKNIVVTARLSRWRPRRLSDRQTAYLGAAGQPRRLRADRDRRLHTRIPDIEIEYVNYPPAEVANQMALAIQGGTGGQTSASRRMPVSAVSSSWAVCWISLRTWRRGRTNSTSRRSMRVPRTARTTVCRGTSAPSCSSTGATSSRKLSYRTTGRGQQGHRHLGRLPRLLQDHQGQDGQPVLCPEQGQQLW